MRENTNFLQNFVYMVLENPIDEVISESSFTFEKKSLTSIVIDFRKIISD